MDKEPYSAPEYAFMSEREKMWCYLMRLSDQRVISDDSSLMHMNAEIERLKRQNTDLQENNTKLVLENRRFKEALKRMVNATTGSWWFNQVANEALDGEDASGFKPVFLR